MSLLLGITGTQLGHVVPGVSAEPSQNYLDLLEGIAGGPTGHWRMNDASGFVMADRGGNDGSYVNGPALGHEAIVENSDGGGSVRFGEGSDYATILNPVTQASFTISTALQIDETPGEDRHTVFHRGAGTTAGDYSLEIMEDGAGGLKPRMFSADAAGDAVVYEGTNNGTVPIGPAFIATYQRDANDGSQRCFIDGSEVAMTLVAGTQPASWPAPPSNDDFNIGMFRGSTNPINGLMAEFAVWDGVVLSASDIADLAVAQSVADLENFSAGTAAANATTPIDLSDHALPETGFVPSVVSQGSLGTATVDGERIDYTAGGTTGIDSFQVEIVNDGAVSRTATITVEVIDGGTVAQWGSGEAFTTPSDWGGDQTYVTPSDWGSGEGVVTG